MLSNHLRGCLTILPTSFRWIRRVAIATVLVLAVSEVAVRLSGITDFQTYSVDEQIGYIVNPNQSGKFLHHNRWAFNDRNMATDSHWNPALHPNILIIGNSIVVGGNPQDQKHKLCPLIQQGIGPNYSVWPVAVGGWTNLNEIAHLERNPDVEASANFFVWEYMVSGTSKLAPWGGDFVFPRNHPLWTSWYVLRRYVLPRFIPAPSEMPPVGPSNITVMQTFRNEIKKMSVSTGKRIPGLLFLYPNEARPACCSGWD